jgi:dUTP pyrophosphatase
MVTSATSVKVPPKPSLAPGDILVKRVHEHATFPVRLPETSIGLDLSSCLISETGRPIQMILPPKTSRLVPTGLIVVAPPGHFLAVCSRSGSAGKQPPIFVANAPGIIDPDFRGELKVILYNGGHESVTIQHGNRIAQLILLPAIYRAIREVSELDETLRGAAGFGSTGA